MRPNTLAQAAERMESGEAAETALAEFLDTFYLSDSATQRCSMLDERPRLAGDSRKDSLLGAVAEYLAHRYALPYVPDWAYEPERYLDRAWHTSFMDDDGMREYLTFASPAEFASRNIFTEEQPLRRARGRVKTTEPTA